MNTSRTIRAIIEDPKFRAVEDYLLDMKQNWLDEATKEKETVELTGMNTLKFASKANAVDQILESLYSESGKELKQKIDNLKDKDYE